MYLRQEPFVENVDLRCSLDFRIQPYPCPTYLQNATDNGVRVLIDALEYRAERVSALIKKHSFDKSGSSGVDERKDEEDVEGAYVCGES